MEKREIAGFPGYYVYEDGCVWSSIKGKGRFIAPALHYKGYVRVSLVGPEGRRTRFVHRLVALAFLPNPDGKAEVNHLDGNKENNHVSNLQWATHQENVQHAYDNRLSSNMGETHPSAKLTPDNVIEIRASYDPRTVTRPALAKKFGASQKTIDEILTLKNWKHVA